MTLQGLSTTVEIILYYLTCLNAQESACIYNSRNYSILLNSSNEEINKQIYNSRNYSILLNKIAKELLEISTTVEIILYYLTVCPSYTVVYLQQ